MSYIFRDFNEPTNHWGDIQVYAINDNTLTVVILGLHNIGCQCGSPGHLGDCGPYFHLLMSVKYSPDSDLYKIICVVLDAITNNYKCNSKHGYIESILDKNNFTSFNIENAEDIKYYDFPALKFKKENMRFLTFHEPMIPNEYEPYVVYGEVSEDGFFKYKGEIIEFKKLINNRDKKGDVFLDTYSRC